MNLRISSPKLPSFLLLGLFTLYHCETIISSSCVQTGLCSCTFPHGVEINLQGSEISKEVNGSKTVIFQPCHNPSDLPIEKNCGRETALCLITVNVEVVDLAGYSDLKFFTSESTGNTYLKSIHNNWTTTIKLQCSHNPSNSAIRIDSFDPTNKTMDLVYVSPRLCLKSISNNENEITFGSILMIIFVLFGCYFIFGCLIKLICYGSQGCEMIPNYDFWSFVLNYIRDFILFCARGCTPIHSYDQI